MLQKFFNSVQTAIFYDFLKIGKWHFFKTRPSHRVTEKGLGIAKFVTSFQAIDRFLVRNRVCFASEGQKS